MTGVTPEELGKASCTNICSPAGPTGSEGCRAERIERPHITLLSPNVPCASGAAPWISVLSHHSGTARSSGVPSTAASSGLNALLAYRNSSLSWHLSPCRDILKYISQGPGGSGPQSRVASGLFWWHRRSVHEELKQLPRDTNSVGHVCKLIKSQVTQSLSGPTFKAPPANCVLPPPGDWHTSASLCVWEWLCVCVRMSVLVNVCMLVCVCKFVCVCVKFHSAWLCSQGYQCVSLCQHACECTCVSACTTPSRCVSVPLCVCVYMLQCVCVHQYVSMCGCVHACVCLGVWAGQCVCECVWARVCGTRLCLAALTHADWFPYTEDCKLSWTWGWAYKQSTRENVPGLDDVTVVF